MKDLLNQSDKRQLLTFELLYAANDWITLSEIAKILNCSVRVLKADIVYFKEVFDEFRIEGSNNGVRLVMNHNIGLGSFYQYILTRSDAYNLIEYVFLNEEVSVVELTEHLSLGSSTVYRLLDHINGVLSKYDIQIETNPCQIVGSESNIRYFFYSYFREKYSFMNWPYEMIPEELFNRLLQYLLDVAGVEIDFSYYNAFQTMSAINIIRYKQRHLIDTNDIEMDKNRMMSVINFEDEVFLDFENETGVKVDSTFIKQVFGPYIQEMFSPTYSHLMDKATKNQRIRSEVNFLEKLLEKVSKKHHITLTNKEELILDIHNLSYLEYLEARSGYVFNNYNLSFTMQMRQKFPLFYRDLYDRVKEYRKLIDKPVTEDGINFLIYVISTRWPNLLTEFRKKFENIHLLVLSDRHISHAEMLKDLIEYEFSEKIVVHVYQGLTLNETILKEFDYDILVANFPLPTTENHYTVYVEAIPTFEDIFKIRNIVDEIFEKRIQTRSEKG